MKKLGLLGVMNRSRGRRLGTGKFTGPWRDGWNDSRGCGGVPIVFMLSASFFTLFYLLTGLKSFDDTAFYCLGGGLLTMPPAVATGLFTHWLNFSGRLHETVKIEKALSYAVMLLGGGAFVWRWFNPAVLDNLRGVNIIYLIMVLSLAPLVTANGYFGGMATFPLEEEAPGPGKAP
jgi:uncharacterized membrane protein